MSQPCHQIEFDARRPSLKSQTILNVSSFCTQAVLKWKNLGKVLCRLLRMSDYWYGFASDGALLSNEERARRRISVLQQVGVSWFVGASESKGARDG